MYRLWYQKSLRRHTTNDKLVAQMPTASKPNPLLDSIISPPGTELWYPDFVLKVHNLLRISNLQTPLIFIALLYIARLRQIIPLTATGHGKEFKLLVAALMTSQKQNSDARYSNRAWSKMTGLDMNDINESEQEFLQCIQWKLHVRDDQYTQWVVTIQTLGKEHAIVLRASSMHESELKKLQDQLTSRPDLVEEINSIRRAHTFPRSK
ncbi:hypothetical protein BC833DRAFT_600420 [Globomyces pollinis-pini]|nr:hypothetical protein BC833DRAFT_600420 [Globomyces pollinis-pini]